MGGPHDYVTQTWCSLWECYRQTTMAQGDGHLMDTGVFEKWGLEETLTLGSKCRELEDRVTTFRVFIGLTLLLAFTGWLFHVLHSIFSVKAAKSMMRRIWICHVATAVFGTVALSLGLAIFLEELCGKEFSNFRVAEGNSKRLQLDWPVVPQLGAIILWSIALAVLCHRGCLDAYGENLPNTLPEVLDDDDFEDDFVFGDRVRFRNAGREWAVGKVAKVVDGRPKIASVHTGKIIFFDEVQHVGDDFDADAVGGALRPIQQIVIRSPAQQSPAKPALNARQVPASSIKHGSPGRREARDGAMEKDEENDVGGNEGAANAAEPPDTML